MGLHIYNGKLFSNVVFDFENENEYSIRVIVYDDLGNNFQKEIALYLKKKGLISLLTDVKKINNILIDDLIKKNKIKINLINHQGKYLIYKKIMSHHKI